MSKHQYHSIFLILLGFVFARSVSAQTSSGHELISTTQGLSQGLINDMLQDREGFIWIATKGGLNRYDGYTFKTFTTDLQDNSSISSNSISNLLEDRYGRLWVSTYDGGVNVYNKKTGRFLRITQKPDNPSGLSSNRIGSAMAELPDGRILLYPDGGSLSVISLSDAAKLAITTLKVPENRTVFSIGKDDKGFIWVGFTDYSIYIFNPSTLSLALLYDGERFTSLIEKTGKFISAKFSQGLDPFTIPPIREELIDSLGQLNPNMIGKGSKEELIIGNHFPIKRGASGCNHYDFSGIKAGDSMKDVYARNLKTNVKDQNIKCLLLDRSGVLWVGTMGHGIYKFRIRNNRFNPILPNLSVQRLTTWDNDMIYVQGWRDTKLINSAGKEYINPVKPFISDAYTNVLKTKNGDYWLYWKGVGKLFRYNADKKLVASYAEQVNTTSTEQLQPLMEDSKHHIWLCGANGTLARVDPKTGKTSKFAINIKQYTGTAALTQTNAFYEDGKGIFWLATEHGFARLQFAADATEPKVKWFKNIPGNGNSLSYNYVSWFMDDPVDPDYLWVSTKGGGLNRMQKSTGNFVHYTTKEGLPNDVVYRVLADNAGNIWGSTNKGLFCLLAEKKDEQPVFRVFSTSDGLQSDEFNTNALAKLTNGDFVFGGVNGVNIFNPKKVLEGNFSPNVFITAIQIGNKTLAPGDKTGILTETIEKTPAITLTYLQDVVTLEFSALDFTAPQQNKYRYQLVGIDKEWVESGVRRTATYLHLPAGNYLFKVQGSNSQGIWSDHIAELKIRVLPPWWLSWWAYLIYALVISFSVRAYLKFNVNKAKLQSQLNYEQLEARRMKELDSIKTQLYTNITHEFRTPLTVILGMAQQVIEKPTELFQTRMDMIIRNGQSLLDLVNQMLDLSKLETGKMNLQLSNGDVIHFLRYIVESFHSLAESQQKQLHFLTDIEVLYVEYDEEKLRQIVSNLLSNAIKFTPEKGNIYISVSRESINIDSPTLIIKIKDTGIGISEDQIQFVFDRFYQTDNSHTRNTEGTGIGLALTKELVMLMEGDISVKSPPTGALKGTEFTVSLPLMKAAPLAENMRKDFKEQRSSAPIIPNNSVLSITANEESDTNVPLILLVEDNADVVAYTASCISEYRLLVGTNGREGFDIATEMIPDLIITDVMMPFMDGFELTTRLRQNENTSHIPIIMLTAKADISSKIEGIQHGADAYLEKPFNQKELLARIKKLLEIRRNLQQYYLKKAGIHRNKLMEHLIMPDKVIGEPKEDSFVKRTREAVEQNLTDINFTVEKLSKLVFMSHSQLHRKLDAVTGCSPNKFIRMIRLKKAMELLQDPTNSIASVAMDCGYDDPGYFARVFKQEYKVTPQKWRASTH
ncbi:ATP-binding protein [Pedobacter sp. B4-66]|uniref:ATP-binding protein n=1 Tax=Pedobacter sp. B4-66 TaxID=2817280 RepID=UPI001BDA1FAC|nr:ATP-binding protein [Pedobacter sp. B4-66]